MRSYPLLIIGMACLAAGGCCSVRERQVAALERENRQLDGMLWELQFQLEALEEENDDLRSRLDEEGGGQTPRPAPSRREEPLPSPRRPDDLPEPGQFRPPVIELPGEPSPEGEIPEMFRPKESADSLDSLPLEPPAGDGARQGRPGRLSSGREASPASFDAEPRGPKLEIVPGEEISSDSRSIERIVLAPYVGGVDMDGKRGDDGIGLVLEPWDAEGRMLAVAAPVSVVLVDPAEPPETARVAHWEIPAEETARLFRDGDIPGIHIALPWTGEPPRNEKLRLFARYTTSDGRKLEAGQEIAVDLGRTAQWVAAETPRAYPYNHPADPDRSDQRKSPAPSLEPADPPEEPIAAAPSPLVRIPGPLPDDESAGEGEPERHGRSPSLLAAAEEPRPLPKVEPAPERNSRGRPEWSPDRPW